MIGHHTNGKQRARRSARLILLLVCASVSTASFAAGTIAFPGAEGAGKFTKGGRGGGVYHVTNLNDSGKGSLREGLDSQKGPRTIVFDISGTIRLKDDLEIVDASHLTIAGQTAPGKGITLADRCLQIKHSKHIIVRYLRVRLGDENKPAGSGPDCVTVEYDDHIILDHLSLSWGIDGNGDFRGLKNTTVQWTIFSEALHDSLHGKGGHAMCTSFRDPQGPSTLHHNIYASSRARHPTINSGAHVMEFCNNVDYNWRNGHNIEGDQLNLLNNYYKAGPEMDATRRPLQIKTQKDPVTARGYFLGNRFEGLPEAYNADNYSAMDFKASGLGFGPDTNYRDTTRKAFEAKERFDAGEYALTDIESAKDAYESCLKYSGCSLARDMVDERFIKTIVDNTGRIIDSQNDVGGWDFYESVKRPKNWDTDGDGMPDAWETAQGLNPKKAIDGNDDRDSDGFTNLEEYLNSLVSMGEVEEWTFDKEKRGDTPAGFEVAETKGKGKPGTWMVADDSSAPSAPNVVALVNPPASNPTFNLLIAKGAQYRDLDIGLQLKAVTGKIDQGGGPIWRVKDANNYYITRWNPLEDNLRLYYVKDAKRVQLESVDIKTDPKAWHSIEVKHVGDHIKVKFDGETVIESDDSTFTEGGMVGLWTKADAATLFDNVAVKDKKQ